MLRRKRLILLVLVTALVPSESGKAQPVAQSDLLMVMRHSTSYMLRGDVLLPNDPLPIGTYLQESACPDPNIRPPADYCYATTYKQTRSHSGWVYCRDLMNVSVPN